MSLARRAAGAMAWTTLGTASGQLLQLAITVALARLLLPADAGLVQAVLVFAGLGTVFGELGLGQAVVQRQDLTERQLSTVFWLTALLGTLTALALAASAPLLVRFYDEPRLAWITPALAPVFLFSSLGAIQTALVMRRLDFRRLATLEVTAVAVAGGCAITVAALGGGPWAYVTQQVVKAGALTGALWLREAWRPSLVFRWDEVRELVLYGANATGARTLQYVNRNADNLLIGRFVGATELGLYAQAYQLMVQPLHQTTAVISRVMFPSLSRLQDDPALVREVWLRANRVIALVAAPAVLGLAAVADPLVLTLLGPAWAGVGPLLAVVCLAGLHQPNGSTAGWLYASLGRTDLQLRWALVSTPLTLVAFAVGVQWGALGVAWALVVRTWLLFPWQMDNAARLIDVRWTEHLRNVGPTYLCAAFMAAVVRLARPELTPALDLAFGVILGVGLYAALALGLRLQAVADVRATREALRR